MKRLPSRISVITCFLAYVTMTFSSQLIKAQVPRAQNAAKTVEVACGCGSPVESNVPCLVTAMEDTLSEKVIAKPAPVYPVDAKTAHISGDVSVGVIIDKTGRVIFAWLESGHVMLSAAALEAVYKLRVKPTNVSGSRVYVKSVVTYRFRLTS